LILLGLRLMVGLRGPMPLSTRFEVIALGVLGTVLVNIARITEVSLLAALAGYLPAVMFHDYGGTLPIVGWLFTFWLLVYRWLVPDPAFALEPLA
jgi:exosortase/archaeosortase family protein